MFNGICHFGSWGAFGTGGAFSTLGPWAWIGLVLNLLLWVGFMAGLVLFVIWAIRRAQASMAPQSAVQPTAKQILQHRFARGEITREEYQRILDDLR